MKTLGSAATGAMLLAVVIGLSSPALATRHVRSSTEVEGLGQMSYDAKTDRYCLTTVVTGSHVPHVDCRTKVEWAQEGLTISRS